MSQKCLLDCETFFVWCYLQIAVLLSLLIFIVISSQSPCNSAFWRQNDNKIYSSKGCPILLRLCKNLAMPVCMFPLFCPSVCEVHLSLSTLKFEFIPYNSRQINAMCPKQNTSKQEWQVFLLVWVKAKSVCFYIIRIIGISHFVRFSPHSVQ